MRNCYNCKSDKTYMIKGIWPNWYSKNNKWYCSRCYNRIFKAPKNNAKRNPTNSPKRLIFKGKRIFLKESPRIGVCNMCRAVAGIDCKKTALHHVKYHDENPLKDTIELCVSCHRKIHVILNRPKRTKKSPMKKNTHEITDIEGLINEKLYIMQNGATMTEKKKARTEVIRLERMLRDIDNKIVSTKGYIKKVPPNTSKKELLALIDSVETPEPREQNVFRKLAEEIQLKGLDESGVSPGKNRFEYVDKGWDKPEFEHRKV